MKFSVAPESRRAGASVLLCAAWMYALRFMDFLLDMYMLSEVFLNWAAWVRCTSALSFSELLVSCEGVSGSGVIGLSSGKLNVTDFVGHVGGLIVSSSLPPSDLSESFKVLHLIESSS